MKEQIGGVLVLSVDTLRGRRRYMVGHGTRVEFLTEREFAVLSSVGAGRSIRQTASYLGIAVSTVEGHVLVLRRKFGVKSKHELLVLISEQAG